VWEGKGQDERPHTLDPSLALLLRVGCKMSVKRDRERERERKYVSEWGEKKEKCMKGEEEKKSREHTKKKESKFLSPIPYAG